jgi:hypothetical protein
MSTHFCVFLEILQNSFHHFIFEILSSAFHSHGCYASQFSNFCGIILTLNVDYLSHFYINNSNLHYNISDLHKWIVDSLWFWSNQSPEGPFHSDDFSIDHGAPWFLITFLSILSAYIHQVFQKEDHSILLAYIYQPLIFGRKIMAPHRSL